MAGPTPTYASVVAHAATFLAELIADPLLRRHLLSAAAAGKRHPAATLQALSLVSDALDTASPPSPSTPAMRVLSLMSGAQAEEARELEREYEKVLDANCRSYALYLRNILDAGDAAITSPPPPPPELVFSVPNDDDAEEDDATVETDEGVAVVSSQNDVRYNPMWGDGDEAADLYPRQGSGKGRRELMRPPSLYPQRVAPHLIVQQQQSPPAAAGRGSPVAMLRRAEHSPATASDDSMDYSPSSSDLLAGREEKLKASPLSRPVTTRRHVSGGGEDEDDAAAAAAIQLSPESASPVTNHGGDVERQQNTAAATTPKDFVCPITSQVFDDPVTLETGQTYERRAIQEWLDRGNSTCPITRQRLHRSAHHLPNTNFVLKRLIASWRDTTMADSPAQFKTASPSPTSVIAQASLDTAVGELRAAVSCLCTSDDLADSEKSVLRIDRLWRDAAAGGGEHAVAAASLLAKPAVVNGFVEILFNSVSAHVLRVAVYLLAELASRDGAVVQTLTRVDSDVDCLVALFKNGLVEAVSLIYLLSPSPEQLVEMDMADALVSTVRRAGGDGDGDDVVKMCVKPKTAAVILLSRILVDGDRNGSSPGAVAKSALVSERFVRSVAASLEAEEVEEKVAAVRILLRCVAEDGHCRSSVVENSTLAGVLDVFHVVGDGDKFDIVRLLSELLKLKRRSAADRLLRMIKEATSFSMMHSLLVYLQSTTPEQSPVVAGLLLQLDLLVEPRKISMYREEALDSLIQCLKNSDYPRSQLLAAETIMNLPGKFSSSGRPLARSSLLKLARVKERYRPLQEMSIVRGGGDGDDEMALSECLKAKNGELFTASLVSATWLVHMLSLLPDTGVLGAARVCLLRQLVIVFRSGKHGSDRALAMVALRSFMNDREGMHEIMTYIKDVLKTLRELKKSSGLAFEMLKLLSDGQESSIGMWNHKELNHADCSSNGGVTSIVYFKGFIFSGHSDGTLKVWEGSENILRLAHESQEHTKAITSLAVLQSEDKLFSGSLDRTIRVWQLRDALRCVEVHDTKDPVQNLAVAAAMACFAPQAAGVKVLSWNSGNSRVLNASKVVRSMALVHGKLFCGCNDSSIQEIDLASGTLGVIQPGNKRILGKASPIYSLHVHGDLLYTGSTSLDGASVKIWNSSNYNLVGTIPSSVEVRSLVVSSDLVYLGSRTGIVEIWSREKLTRIGALQAGGAGCRVQCMAVDGDGDVLVVGTSDGRIQAWGLT
uniref:RING-type E3 ubiquitin transferase n=1 Tax=Leersia perrieri TaxID=77586 RepID=A0A0D9UYS1_9ORYZ